MDSRHLLAIELVDWMQAKIRYMDKRGRTLTSQVRPGQRLVVGSSFSADIVLGDMVGVVSEHAELFLKSDGFTIRNLTGNVDTVLVNGQPTSKSNLADGDSVEIGSNKLAVSFEDPNSQTETTMNNPLADVKAAESNGVSRSNESAVEAGEEGDFKKGKLERYGNVSILTVESFRKSVFPLTESAESQWVCHLICNHLRSGLKSGKPESVNFLENGPADIADENDLFLLPVEDQTQLEEHWNSYVSKDAGVIAINESEDKASAVKEQFQLLSAWFMIPSTLKFHLTNGSPLLLDKVFGLFDFLVIANENGDEIFTNDLSIDSVENFLDRIKGANE